jgi:hypothetical protein
MVEVSEAVEGELITERAVMIMQSGSKAVPYLK